MNPNFKVIPESRCSEAMLAQAITGEIQFGNINYKYRYLKIRNIEYVISNELYEQTQNVYNQGVGCNILTGTLKNSALIGCTAAAGICVSGCGPAAPICFAGCSAAWGGCVAIANSICE